MQEKLYLIDTITPFFVRKIKQTVNWSKVPFAVLEKKGKPKKKTFKEIEESFSRYLRRVKSYGFNGISLDELCYLLEYPFYPPREAKKIRRYRRYLGRLIQIAFEMDFRVFITTDIVFSNEYLQEMIPQDFASQLDLLYSAFEQVFRDFPLLSGAILRIGEADGVDVEGFFQSRLLVRTAAEGNTVIHKLLPLFEAAGRTMIFRTWTAGANKIGDLMWNPLSLDRLLRGVESDFFVLSMKYGESDFFRYLDVSPHFFSITVKLIVELQTRREYEGFGSYPSFVGWEYRRIHRRLKDLPNLAGIHVWCQTGGWSRFRDRTFLKKSSLWNELNTWVTIRMFRYDESVKKALKGFHRRYLQKGRKLSREERRKEIAGLRRFLKLSDYLVLNVLYIPGFASQSLYVHKMRVPPLIHAFWNSLTVTPLMRALIRSTGAGFELNYRSFLKVLKEMRVLARELSLPYDAVFHRDLFTLYYFAQEALSADHPRRAMESLERLQVLFRERYQDLYDLKILPLGSGFRGFLPGLAARLLLRRRRGYRILDRLLFSPPMITVYTVLLKRTVKQMPSFVNSRAMSIEELIS